MPDLNQWSVQWKSEAQTRQRDVVMQGWAQRGCWEQEERPVLPQIYSGIKEQRADAPECSTTKVKEINRLKSLRKERWGWLELSWHGKVRTYLPKSITGCSRVHGIQQDIKFTVTIMSHAKSQPRANSGRVTYNHNRAGLEKQAAEGDGEQQKNLNPSPRKTNEPTHQWREPGETLPLDPQKYTSPKTPRISQGKAEVMLV